MPLEISPIPKSAAAQQMRLMYDAYQDDIVSKPYYDVPASPEVIQGSIDGILAGWDNDPSQRRQQVIDSDTREMISIVVWQAIPRREGEEWKTPPVVADRAGWHGDAYKTILRNNHLNRVKFMGAEPYICEWCYFEYFRIETWEYLKVWANDQSVH